MRILHVVPTYAPAWRYGGPIHAVHGLCRSLVGAGHDVTVYTTSVDGPVDLDVPLAMPVDYDGVRVNYFPSPFLRRTYWSPAMGNALRKQIRCFDVVHAHSVFLWPTWLAARSARRSGTPLVLSPRGMLVPELIAARSAWLKRSWIRAIERRNLREAAVIHVTSSGEARDLERAGLSLAPVRRVPNGVDLPEFSSSGSARDSRTILFLGRINWKKGLDRLIRAMPMLSNTQLQLAGNDEESLQPVLERLAREIEVADRVQFLGHVAGDAKRDLLGRATLLVLPSLSENFGNVVVEALAQGCPVVVAEGVGAAEIVTECGGGVVCAGDPEALANAIRSIIDDPQRAGDMGERGRLYVRANLGWDCIARRMSDLYAEAIATSRR